MRILTIAAALMGMLVCLCFPASAAMSFWSDDLESGSGNWTVYPDCSPLLCVTTSTDSNCNHTADGSAGLKIQSKGDRVYHDLDLGAYAGSTLVLSAWLYDEGVDQETVFDIRDAGNNQVLGMGKSILNGDPTTYASFYQCRALRNADGQVGVNWANTSILRSVGWHQFTIMQYRGDDAGTAKYYIDGDLGYTATGLLDYDLNRIVLGTGWGTSPATGYIDDISVAVPEPGSLLALAFGLIPLGLRRRRR